MAVTVPAQQRLVRRRPFLVGALVSLITVAVLFASLIAIASVVGLSGCALAAAAGTPGQAGRASTVVSLGVGLAVGPVAYIALWLAVSAVS